MGEDIDMVTTSSTVGAWPSLAPASSWTTTSRSGAVQLRLSDSTLSLAPPMTLPTLITLNCQRQPHFPAMKVKRNNVWVQWTYGDYYKQIRQAAKAMIALGLQPYHSVAISGFNSPEWFITALAAIFAGGFSAGLYPTNGPETNRFVLADSEANLLFVEDAEALAKMLPLLKADPVVQTHLKAIVQWSGEVTEPDVLSWSDFMAMGEKNTAKEESGSDALESQLSDRLCSLSSNKCAVLIYTSGTTGSPKGVMLSHDNIIFNVASGLRLLKFRMKYERMITYLPLSHVAALTVDLFSPLFSFTTVYFAEKGVLRSGPKLLELLRFVRPTRFFGVPRVYEKIMEGMMEKARVDNPSGLRRQLVARCRQAALDHHCGGKVNNVFYRSLGKNVVYKKVKEALGLDACLGAYSGAAPLRREVFDFFISFDILLLEGFGLSESTGPATYNLPEKFRPATVGLGVPGTELKLRDDGELAIWGRNVMMGYLNCEHKTQETFDQQGWMSTGDQGHIDDQGFVAITGRFKELLITAGGENVAPVPIEDRIKKELGSFVSNVVVVGDRRKFISALFTLKTESEESDQLTPAATIALKAIVKRDLVKVSDVLKAEKEENLLREYVNKALDKVNKEAVNNASRVQKFTFLPNELSIAGGELGPTMKLKRFVFAQKYEHVIDALYN